jgi:hypothetical protein
MPSADPAGALAHGPDEKPDQKSLIAGRYGYLDPFKSQTGVPASGAMVPTVNNSRRNSL